MKQTTEATLHTCDGCGTTHVQLAGQDLPTGFYVEVMFVNSLGADGGKLYCCKEKCVLPAFKRRGEVWND